MLQKISVSNKYFSFELSIRQKNPEKNMITVSTKIVSSIDNNKKCYLSTESAYYNALPSQE